MKIINNEIKLTGIKNNFAILTRYPVAKGNLQTAITINLHGHHLLTDLVVLNMHDDIAKTAHIVQRELNCGKVDEDMIVKIKQVLKSFFTVK